MKLKLGLDLKVDVKHFSDAEGPDWLVIYRRKRLFHLTRTIVALYEGPGAVRLHLLRTLYSTSRAQAAVVPLI